ncbi:MAG: hypothetical protein Q8M29_02640 [Bacteroidota bacterium]|nr:hypothetical protein [Bacteroidota bacterium]
MGTITFKIGSNEEIWELIDKSINHVFIHKFDPHEVISWWDCSLKNDHGLSLENTSVRNMSFDLQTNLEGLKKILALNTRYLNIYQFKTPVPDTLTIEHLPENSKDKILAQNGLEHVIFIEFEFATIKSSNSEYLKATKEKINPINSDQ